MALLLSEFQEVTELKINKLTIGIIAVIGASMTVYLGMPRGLRNNNPTNIRYNKANAWNGQTGKDSAGFAKFDSAHNGIRAGAKLLRNYQSMHNLNTLEQILGRFAPPVENDTKSYIKSVSQSMKVAPDSYLALSSDFVLIPLVQAIIKHENGINPFSYETIYNAVQAAK